MNSLKTWVSRHYLLIAIFLGLFSSLLEDVYENDPKVLNADINVAKYITSIRTPELNDFFLFITQLGNTVPLVVFITAAFLFFFIIKKYSQLVTIFLTTVGCGVIIIVIKEVVQRARPIDGLIVEHGFSFPSGHAFIGVCFWGVLFYLFSTLVKNRFVKMGLILFGIILALLIGFSRVYIGVHWPSDVIASYLLSSVYVLAVILLVNNKQKLFSLVKNIKS